MTLQATFRSAHAALMSANPDLTVSVVSQGQTYSGLRSSGSAQSGLDEMMQIGVTTGRVRVSAAEMEKPDRGSTILVGGEAVFVMNVQTDAVGALYIIDYQDQRPVEGI